MGNKVTPGLGLNSGNGYTLDPRELSTVSEDGKTITVTLPPSIDRSREIVVKTEDNSEKKFSRESVRAAFFTLFSNFGLTAIPVYNFYTENEVGSEFDSLLDRNLQDVPRYIHLKWRTAPDMRPRPAINKAARNISFGTDQPQTSFLNQGTQFSPAHLKDFSLARKNLADGFLSPGMISTAVDVSPSVRDVRNDKFLEEKFLLNPSADGIPFHEFISNLRVGGEHVENLQGDFVPRKLSKTQASAKVTFVDPFIEGLLSDRRVNSFQKSEQVETASAIAPLLGNLAVLSRVRPELPRKPDIPSFPTPMGVVSEYIGYVIEKYRQNPSDGNFVLFDEIEIPDRTVTEFVDTAVGYGVVYRYRIRAVFRWVRPSNVGTDGVKEISSLDTVFAQTSPAAGYRSSYFPTAWSDWCVSSVLDLVPPPPPDEIQVMADSAKKKIVITWKHPDDSQRDIAGFILFRKEVVGDVVSDWSILAGPFPPRNGLYEDKSVEYSDLSEGIKYVYALRTFSKHSEISPLSTQLMTEIRSDYSSYGRTETTFFSQEGVPLEAHGIFSRIPLGTEKTELTGKTISLRVRQGLSSNQSVPVQYVLRVESLETGEIQDFPIDISYDNLNRILQERKDGEVKLAMTGGPLVVRP